MSGIDISKWRLIFQKEYQEGKVNKIFRNPSDGFFKKSDFLLERNPNPINNLLKVIDIAPPNKVKSFDDIYDYFKRQRMRNNKDFKLNLIHPETLSLLYSNQDNLVYGNVETYNSGEIQINGHIFQKSGEIQFPIIQLTNNEYELFINHCEQECNSIVKLNTMFENYNYNQINHNSHFKTYYEYVPQNTDKIIEHNLNTFNIMIISCYGNPYPDYQILNPNTIQYRNKSFHPTVISIKS